MGGGAALSKTQVDTAPEPGVTLKIYFVYKVKNRRKMAVHVAGTVKRAKQLFME